MRIGTSLENRGFMQKLLILDRDGVVNNEYGDVYKEEDFSFTPGFFEMCKKYQDKGFKIVVCSNQSGIAKGLFTLEQYKNITYYMVDECRKRNVFIEKSYVCPHRDSDNCSCHKPAPGMILKAIEDFDASVKMSVAVGDKMSDIDAYHAAGLKKIYFLQAENPVRERDFDFKIVNSLEEI